MEEASEELIGMLGRPYDARTIAGLLMPFGVKRMPSPSSPMDDDIIWSVKASLRMDVYRPRALARLTGRTWAEDGAWIIGSIHFLAPDADSRIRAMFPGRLPSGVGMESTPQDLLAAFGPARLDEETGRPGHRGQLLAWRGLHTNMVAEYAQRQDSLSMSSFVVCLIGCIGAWRRDDPQVFAP
jgi:hypothetical protein